MEGQRRICIAGVFVAMLLQTIAVVGTTAKKQAASSHAVKAERKSLDLEEAETSYANNFPTNGDFFNTYQHSAYHSSSPSYSQFPSSSYFFDSVQNISEGIHRQIKCGDRFKRVCENSRYRSYDGSCNNLRNPTWGMSNTRYGRILPARYSDGIRSPTKSITGRELPLARTVSYNMFLNIDINDRIWSLMAMQFGQIMTHDMGLIDGTTQSKSHRTRCCTFYGQMVPDLSTMPQCFPILVPHDDPVYSQYSVRCMNFIRSTTDRDYGCTTSSHQPAEQINTVTHYLDLSLVYGSDDRIAASLRANIGGRLNVELRNNREFPPPAPNKTAICDIVHESEPCYATGDTRGNQNPQLTILQIVLLREHNRVANILAHMNPHWNDETTFQETRRIVIAEYQKISYYEWLLVILGLKQTYVNNITYNTKNYVNDYDETVNANVLNENANAAMRYFHSLIVGNLDLVSEHREYSPFHTLRLSDYFNRPGVIEKGNNLDDLARGLSYQPQKAADVYFDKEITQNLFRRGRHVGQDLRATDIQRDRDHALASYNDYREYCGLPRAKSFDDFADYISLPDIHKLSMLYESPDDVELTVGGGLERDPAGMLSGPTFFCILIKQFQMSRIGDRYWFESGNPEVAFTIEQLNEIRNASISRLLCDNGDNIQSMQRLGFVQVSELNPLWKCDDLPRVDLSLWKDYSPEAQDYQHFTIPQYKKK